MERRTRGRSNRVASDTLPFHPVGSVALISGMGTTDSLPRTQDRPTHQSRIPAPAPSPPAVPCRACEPVSVCDTIIILPKAHSTNTNTDAQLVATLSPPSSTSQTTQHGTTRRSRSSPERQQHGHARAPDPLRPGTRNEEESRRRGLRRGCAREGEERFPEAAAAVCYSASGFYFPSLRIWFFSMLPSCVFSRGLVWKGERALD